MSDHRVITGDCLTVLPTLESESVDAIVTDPPYSSGGAFRGDRTASTRSKYVQSDAKHDIADFTGDTRDQRGYLAWCALWMGECMRIAKPGAIMAAFTDWRQLPTTTDALQCAGWVWRGIAVWGKANARPCKGRYAAQSEFIVWGTKGPRALEGACGRGWWMADTPRGDDREHQTQKPIEVMEGLLAIVPVGGLVLDPFAGSGTTGVAAVRTGRNFIGCEQSAHFADIARARIAHAVSERGIFTEACA